MINEINGGNHKINPLDLFPPIESIDSKLEYDDEGIYSITNHAEADYISKFLKASFMNSEKLSVLDGTGGLGGNTFSFSKYFTNVTSIELNSNRYKMLLNNINIYQLKNIKTLNIDSVEYLYENFNNYNIYFFDPPWGGPSYKKKSFISLKLGNKSLLELALYLKENTHDKLLVYKLPFNYNFNEFYEFNYKLCKIKNYYIIIISI